MLGPSFMKFLEISQETNDKQETERLFQHILLTVMRGNAYSYEGLSLVEIAGAVASSDCIISFVF